MTVEANGNILVRLLQLRLLPYVSSTPVASTAISSTPVASTAVSSTQHFYFCS